MNNIKQVKTSPQKALGYMRISDKKQIKGESKHNQKAAIKKYALANNIEIVEWFYDEAKSGKNTEREELKNLIKTALKMKGVIDYVVVYKMNRASRDLGTYINGMRSILVSKGIKIRSATEQFDDSPMGNFMENLYVMVAQLDNENKRETVTDNMTSLAKQGYWQHKPPRGYKMVKVKNADGNPRPSLGPSSESRLVSKILMRFNRGDILVSELCRYATAEGFLNVRGKPITQEVITKLIKRPEYAGFVCDKFTNFEPVKGKHDGLIEEAVYWQNQEILKQKSKKYLLGLKHMKINIAVPLRRFILCIQCNQTLTSSAPGGEYRYFCHRVGCRGSGSITARDAHSKFEELLSTVTPKASTIKLMKEILIRTSIRELGNINQDLAETRDKLDDIATTRANIIKKFANGKLEEDEKDEATSMLAADKLNLVQELNDLEQRQTVSESSIDYALGFMENISKQWYDASLDLKQKMQELIFPKGFVYDIKNDNFIISEISPLYRGSDSIKRADDFENSVLVSHVDQNWKPLLEGLEQISLAVEEHILSEEDCDV